MIYAAIIPLTIGILILIKPQLFTKIDLSDSNNIAEKRKLLKAGWLAIAGGCICLITVLL